MSCLVNEHKFIEVCAGAGGLSCGFINKGFKALILNEKDKRCCETLKLNHPHINVVCEDMKNINFNEYKPDILMGGVPCQSWSQAGKRLGLNDNRGNLLLTFCDIINQCIPKCFLIENVVGLKTHNKGATLNLILKKLTESNLYNVYHKVLNANNYGVAQKRKRIFIVGVHKNIKKIYQFPAEEKYKPVLKDVLLNVPESKGYEYSPNKKLIMDKIPPGGCWVNLSIEDQQAYMKKSYYSGGGKRGIARRLSMNEACLTLTTSPCQKQTERCHPLETRPFTIREYARIQSFPDTYKFCGSISQQYKQIGNAVPVKLSEHIAKSIKKVLS